VAPGKCAGVLMNRNRLAFIGYKFKEVYGVDQTTCPDLFGAFLAGYMQHDADLKRDARVAFLSGEEIKRAMTDAGIAEYKNE